MRLLSSFISSLARSPEISERNLELQLFFGERLDLLDEVLEGGLEFVSHLSLHLLCVEVVAVVHVLVFAQICGDLAHLRVELHVCVALLPEHDGVLRHTQHCVTFSQCTDKHKEKDDRKYEKDTENNFKKIVIIKQIYRKYFKNKLKIEKISKTENLKILQILQKILKKELKEQKILKNY